MSVLYTAAQCPAVIVPTVAYTKAAAYAGSSDPPVAAKISATPTTLIGAFNKNAMQLDLTGRYGGGGYAVAYGLGLSAGTGLNLTIAIGHALIDGVVELASAATLALPPNSNRLWVWLLSDGTVTYTTTTTPPSASCCLLGNCSTVGSGFSVIDTSGVMYLTGGMLWRQTADTGQPGDSPPATAKFYTRTSGGLYLWDGTAYSAMGIDITDLSDFAVAAEERIYTLEQQVASIVDLFVSNGFEFLLEDENLQLLYQ